MRKIIKILPFLLMSFDVFGQLTPITSQYVLNPVIINPAYAGSRGALNLAAFYRNQWVNIKGAPVTMTFSIDAPISKEKIGLGLMIVNDKIGVTKETNFISSYAYKIGIGDGNLSLGLSAGMSVTNTHWSDLVVLDPGDQLYLTNPRIYIIPNFSFGLYYSYHNFYSGLSLPKLLTYKFDYQKNKYALSYKPKDRKSVV
jgi:type IX secretion system PorP/SprF family membrane protein